MEILYQPRPDYARGGVELEQRNRLGLWCRCCGGTALLVSEVPLAAAPGGSEARARVVIGAGERRWLSFSYCAEAPAVIPPLGAAARERYQTSLRWWRDWEGRCGYHGPFRDEVLRSAMVLKLMIYAPSGAIVASPTTSLPERIGGIRNWDYRYCWLRDASFTLRALFSLGYTDDEAAFVDWLLHLTRLTWPELQVLYDVFGESELPERELGHLEGYARSRPVHVGNGSHAQFQLDVYGELIEAMSAFVRRGGTLNRGTVGMLNRLGKTVCGHWREPDNGIWEMRAGRRHHTYSKVLAWVALDRLIALHEMGYAPISAKLFRGERDALRGEIERRGYNERLNSYTSSFDGEQVDASLLLLPFYGYIAADAPRMRSSYALIRERLGRGSLLYRYERGADDGLPPGEGSFGICAFWEAGYLAESGDLAGARRSFEELLAYGNDLGLFAEEIGEDGAALGNFPQAFTHIGLINAALTLAEKERT